MKSFHLQLRWLRRCSLLFASTFALLGSLVAPPAVAAASDYTVSQEIFNDNFSRTVKTGLGTSSSGMTYTTSGTASVSVENAARVSLRPGQNSISSLPKLSALDARGEVDLTLSALPNSGNGTSTTLGLRASSNSAYTATIRITKAGSIAVKIERTIGGATATLVADKVIAKGAAKSTYRFAFQVTGTNPVELAARAYTANSTAPEWQAKVADASASRLSTAGYPQLKSYQSSSSPAAVATYDNLTFARVTKTTTPTAPIDDTPPISSPTEGGSSVGSTAVGKANYSVPSGAIYVAAKGTNGGAGTLANPYGSLATALTKASNGSTIVMRRGTYHESVEVPFYKALTIQNYPNEEVWLDGASVVSGWKQSGSTWYTDWNYNFNHTVSFTKGQDETSWWVNSKHPMAGYPDQVWVNGTPLTQVGSASSVAAGKFFIDRSAKRLVIGTNPSGQTVEASTLQKALTVHGAGTTLRGFGVRRYAPTVNQMGAVSLEVANIEAENLIVSDNATIGLVTWGKNLTLNRISLLRNGLMGAMISSTNTLMTNSDISFNNTEFFNEKPVAGGIKVGQMSHATFKNNLFEGNHVSNGLWFDTSSYDITVAGNTFLNNGYDGLEVEITDTAKVVGNYAIGNASSGIRLFDTSHAEVWNNTVTGNRGYAIQLMQDYRRSGKTPVTFLMSAVNFRNNVVSFQSGTGCPLLFQDTTSTYTGAQLGVKFDSNVYYRASSSATTNFACWPIGSPGIKGYKSLAEFQEATGNDRKSKDFTGTSILDANYKLTPAARSATASLAAPVDSATAKLLSVSSSWQGVGAQGPVLHR